MESEEEQEMHSFPYEATVDGKDHFYRITQQHEKYGVEQDGVVIAELAHEDGWRQLSGTALSKKLLESICDHIEAHYG